jgi:hypothetical protein
MENMVGPNGLEPSTSSVSRKRSNQTELRACITGNDLWLTAAHNLRRQPCITSYHAVFCGTRAVAGAQNVIKTKHPGAEAAASTDCGRAPISWWT